MKIHNYGNDYVQARKFEKESVKDVENKTTRDEPTAPRPTEIKDETEAETKMQVKKFGKKKVNNPDNI